MVTRDRRPDIILEQNNRGVWTASGPSASRKDGGATLAEALEAVASNHPRDVLVEVRSDTGDWRATAGELADDYGRYYADPGSVDMEEVRRRKGDPFFDY